MPHHLMISPETYVSTLMLRDFSQDKGKHNDYKIHEDDTEY